MNEATTESHNIILNSRSNASLDGVTGVISFDERTVVLKTVLGELTIDGEQLNITKLEIDQGRLLIEGNICGMFYSDAETKPTGKRRSLFGN